MASRTPILPAPAEERRARRGMSAAHYVRIRDDVAAELAEYATESGVTQRSVIERAVWEYLKKKGRISR